MDDLNTLFLRLENEEANRIMKRREKILAACGVAVIAVEAALILICRIPMCPYEIDWPIFLKKILGF